MNSTYWNAVATEGSTLITHIGLVDDSNNELSGGSPSYARQAVTWTSPSGGTIRPDSNLTFNVPASTTVAGWQGYSASTGGTAYGIVSVDNEVYSAQGECTLLAASTAIHHTDPA